jgi:hypothetical protein
MRGEHTAFVFKRIDLQRLRNSGLEHMRNRFIKEFGLPLSVTLLTTNEWDELSEFFTDKSIPVPITGVNMRIGPALSRAGESRPLPVANTRR